ncbi:MAG: hypothetical protein WC447_01610 [Candidatus Paceibacterota bacterium]|jgi:sporulation-control protein spo0M
MSSKKSLITVIVIIIVLIAGWYLWKGVGTAPVSTPLTGETSQPGAEGQTSEQTGSGDIGKMTDDIYVELIAQAAYQAQKDPASYASTMQNLYEKYGITEENITAYGEALSKDPTRAQAIAQKYAEELQKLMK